MSIGKVFNLSFKAILSYDGTRYFGWQKTKTGPSIQEELEKAILRITSELTQPEAASRTDRGVHAEGQTVHFYLKKEFEPQRLQRGLNAVLPPDIRIVALESVSPHFHPTLQAEGKEYHYRLSMGLVQDPIHRHYSWHVPHPLDLIAMEKASQDLLGKHDFTSLANESEKNPYCTLEKIRIGSLDNGMMQISLNGDRFLYKMARNIVGTLVYIGCGKLPLDCIPSLLASRDRKKAGITAPAQGLFLHQVFYNISKEGKIVPC